MSEVTIYQALRNGGLGAAGACAVMGNMWAESSMIPNNVQNNCKKSDEEYTSAVDNGWISAEEFESDKYGYGLCQWTFPPRKKELLAYARSMGVSIGDEAMQCQFCLKELKRDFSGLNGKLRTLGKESLYDLTDQFCREFENPQFKNVNPRYQKALEFYNLLAGDSGPAESSSGSVGVDLSNIPEGDPYVEIGLPVLRRGSKGNTVKVLQAILKLEGYLSGMGCVDGKFGEKTESAVKKMQKDRNQFTTGIMDQGSWQVLFL